MTRWIISYLAVLTIILGATPSDAQNLFFLHHSTGRHLLTDGTVRAWLTARNEESGTHYLLWDHDYNYLGLSNPDGHSTDRCYNIPDDNTDPDGLHKLWTTNNTARDSILANHKVVAFKSCYPASDIGSDAELAQYKNWYREMRDFFDTKPATTFIVMTMPPRHPLATNLEDADRARAFANWLDSDEFLAGHNNISCFNLFAVWAHPDDGSDQRNMLRAEYVRSASDPDSHPNELANQIAGPIFAEFLTKATTVPVGDLSLGGMKSFFR